MSDEDLVVVGRIRRSHGLHGIVVVEPMTASAEEVFSPGRELIAGTVKGEAADPARFSASSWPNRSRAGFRVQFAGIADRNEAERWRDRYVLSPRADLPEPDENEIYLHDLCWSDGGGRTERSLVRCSRITSCRTISWSKWIARVAA
jgi:16S rRNA processing protein RimM